MSFSNLIIANENPGLVPNDGLITAKISGLYGINSITIKMYGSYAAFCTFICKKDMLFLSSCVMVTRNAVRLFELISDYDCFWSKQIPYTDEMTKTILYVLK